MTRTLLFVAVTLLALASPALAQSGDNVLLVVNESSADSGRIAEAYARTRGVPQTQLLHINEPIALNNLADALAVRKGQAAEAIGYAERAHTLTRGHATIADTLAWIQHLLGRDREAAPLLAGAVRTLPGNAEVRLHAAVVYAAIGMAEPAAKELAEALRLDPAPAKSDEVKALQGKLAGK